MSYKHFFDTILLKYNCVVIFTQRIYINKSLFDISLPIHYVTLYYQEYKVSWLCNNTIMWNNQLNSLSLVEEPDYENLFVYRNQPTEANKPGPEPADLPQYNERKGEGFVWMPVLYLLVFFGFSCNILPFIWYGDDYCIKWSGSDGTHRALQWNIWLMWSLANMAWIWNILSSQRYVRTSCITPNVQALLVTKTSPTKLDDWMSVCVCRELGLKKGFFYVIIFDNLKYYKGKRFYYVTPRFSNKSRVFDKLLGAWLLRFL